MSAYFMDYKVLSKLSGGKKGKKGDGDEDDD